MELVLNITNKGFIMIKMKVFLLSLLFLISLPSYSCGTPDNWMDAYEGIDSGNKWRDSMSKLEKLVMLRSCGGSSMVNESQQTRMLTILTDAMSHKYKYSMMRTKNRDVQNQVRQYRGLIAYEGLVESIYRRFYCLNDAQVDNIQKISSSNVTLFEYFSRNACPDGDTIIMKINAPNGGRIRSKPNGSVISSLRHGLKIIIVGKSKDWYRVINPARNGNQNSMIGYVHESILVNVK